jgi:hypothetical protein
LSPVAAKTLRLVDGALPPERLAWSGRGDRVRREFAMSENYLVRYVGGPLDGRVDRLSAMPTDLKATVTHVHLHGGPKIVNHYDLHYAVEYGCEYRLRGHD